MRYKDNIRGAKRKSPMGSRIVPRSPLKSPVRSNFDARVCKTLQNNIDLVLPAQNETSALPQQGRCIPQKMYTTTYEYSPLPAESDRLLFFLQDGLCLPVTAALEDNFTGLINANGVAIGPSTNVSLRFEWPGYRPKRYQMKTVDQCTPPRRLTVSQIAKHVAKRIKRFIEQMEDVPIAPEHAMWRVGPGGIKPEDLYLVSLDRVSKGSWQPRLLYRPTQRTAPPNSNSVKKPCLSDAEWLPSSTDSDSSPANF